MEDVFQFAAGKLQVDAVFAADQVADALVAQIGFIGIRRLFRQDFDDLGFFMAVEVFEQPSIFPGYAAFGVGDDKVESRLAVIG